MTTDEKLDLLIAEVGAIKTSLSEATAELATVAGQTAGIEAIATQATNITAELATVAGETAGIEAKLGEGNTILSDIRTSSQAVSNKISL